jgi:hypothetical protein
MKMPLNSQERQRAGRETRMEDAGRKGTREGKIDLQSRFARDREGESGS